MTAALANVERDVFAAAGFGSAEPAPLVARVKIRAVCKCGCGGLTRFFVESSGRVLQFGLPTRVLAMICPEGRA